MTILITTPGGTTSPLLWMRMGTTRTATTTVHVASDGDTIIVHGTPPISRGSTLALLYTDESESDTAERLLAAGGVCSIVDPARPTHSMDFVVTGEITRDLDTETASVWIITAQVQEVNV